MDIFGNEPKTAAEHEANIEKNFAVSNAQNNMAVAGGVMTGAASALSIGALTALYKGKIANDATLGEFSKGLWNAAKQNKAATVAILAVSTALGAISVLSNRKAYERQNQSEVGKSFVALRGMAAEGNPVAQQAFGKWSNRVIVERENSNPNKQR